MGLPGTFNRDAVLCAPNAVETLPKAGCGLDDLRISFAPEEPVDEMVLSQGERHDLGGMLSFLDNASRDGLSRIDLRQTHMASKLRKEVMDLIEAWIDALALKRFTLWQMIQPREIRGAKRAVLDGVPDDLNCLDPFFRTVGESAAIRRNQPSYKIRRWPIYFERFGCLCCASKEGYCSIGLCRRCHVLITSRLREVELDLRCEFRESEGRG